MHSRLDQGESFVVQLAVSFYVPGLHLAVAEYLVPFEAFELNSARLYDPLSDLCGRFTRIICREVLVRDCRDLDMDVYPVEQRP